jgi:hypothetical protein
MLNLCLGALFSIFFKFLGKLQGSSRVQCKYNQHPGPAQKGVQQGLLHRASKIGRPKKIIG